MERSTAIQGYSLMLGNPPFDLFCGLDTFLLYYVAAFRFSRLLETL
jgi:hypothetical protein